MKYEIRNTKYESQRGFTVLESIVAILVLSLAISGVFAAVRQGLSQGIIAKDEIKAAYLAQEAVEIIRNQRDNNRLASIDSGTAVPWLTVISGCVGSVCKVDATGPGGDYISPCGSDWGSCPPLRQDPNTFLYSYDSDLPESGFTREVKIEKINDDEVAVTVRVTWSKGTISNQFETKASLFNWI